LIGATSNKGVTTAVATPLFNQKSDYLFFFFFLAFFFAMVVPPIQYGWSGGRPHRPTACGRPTPANGGTD
jgi:hypothetical protein